jgi:hypothetical protein
MAFRTVHFRVARRLPIGVVNIHFMAGIAKARLSSDNNRPGTKKRQEHNQQ